MPSAFLESLPPAELEQLRSTVKNVVEQSLPELDKRKTKKALEAIFAKYLILKPATFRRREMIGVISDGAQTSQNAPHSLDDQDRRLTFCRLIERIVEELDDEEKFLIEHRYMNNRRTSDLVVYRDRFDPPISPTTYDVIRWSGFQKLAVDFIDLGMVKEESVVKSRLELNNV